MRVAPPGEQPFELELKASLKVLFMPRAGDSIALLYDPGDHSRVVIDPAQDLAPRLRTRSGVRAEVALPSGREAIVEAQSAPSEHRAELEQSRGGKTVVVQRVVEPTGPDAIDQQQS